MRTGKQKDLKFTIVAGSLKGKIITAPDLGVTRPPLTRLRRAIFDFLTPHLEGARYLDLFSGTGSYLFEAVSRGVAEGVGVEREPTLAQAINDQAGKLGVRDRLRCVNDDVFKAIPHFAEEGRAFDIAMIAPPQYEGLIDKTLRLFEENRKLIDRALLVCQHDSSETATIDFGEFSIDQQRKYGNTTFTILK